MVKAATILFICLVVFGGPCLAGEEAPATEPAKKTVEEQIKGLIEELGAPLFEIREKASEALKKIGEPALPMLREVVKTTKDMEVKIRAEDAIQGIEKAIEEKRIASLPKVKVGPLVKRTKTVVNGVMIEWGEDADGNVMLKYPDPETGKEKEATARSWKDFLRLHPKPARQFDITEKGPRARMGGIQFGGIRIQVRAAAQVKKKPKPARKETEESEGKVRVGPLVSKATASAGGIRIIAGADAEGNVLLELTDSGSGKKRVFTAKSWKDLLERLRLEVKRKQGEKKTVRLERFGLTVEEVPEGLRCHLGLAEGKGALVRDVTTGGEAEKLGIRKFDIVVSVDGVDVGTSGLRERMAVFRKISILHGGKRIELERKKEPEESEEPPGDGENPK